MNGENEVDQTRMIERTSYCMNFVIGSTNTITCLKNSSLVSSHRISGNAASDKNIKDGVCAQIEKNFAKAKWKVFLLIHLIYHSSRVSYLEDLLCCTFEL